MTGIANQLSVEKYRSKAASYDQSAQFTMPLRVRAIAGLRLRPGDVVLDVGAGTGLSYALLLEQVGRTGKVLAFEQSPDMFLLAQDRVAQHAWTGIDHQCASAEKVQLPQAPSAVLFNYVHDITRTPAAIDNIVRQLAPRARVAVAGVKFFPWWTGPLNLVAWAKNRPYNVKAADLWSPWDLLQAYCDDWQWQATQAGMGYVASGTLSADAIGRATASIWARNH